VGGRAEVARTCAYLLRGVVWKIELVRLRTVGERRCVVGYKREEFGWWGVGGVFMSWGAGDVLAVRSSETNSSSPWTSPWGPRKKGGDAIREVSGAPRAIMSIRVCVGSECLARGRAKV
jgi:hypothetical protein